MTGNFVNGEVLDIINRVYEEKNRIRIFYGDVNTGKAWAEEYSVLGRVGRSTGTQPVPILLHNKTSHGGSSILTNCIVAIYDVKTHRALYKHPNFQPGTWTYSYDGIRYTARRQFGQEPVEEIASFDQENQAIHYCQFMRGHRFNK
jgi:hypothetical protein